MIQTHKTKQIFIYIYPYHSLKMRRKTKRETSPVYFERGKDAKKDAKKDPNNKK